MASGRFLSSSRTLIVSALAVIAGLAGCGAVAAQGTSPPAGAGGGTSTDTTSPVPPAGKLGQTMQKLSGVWVEGPGFEITYGAAYDTCAKRCLANATCVMIEHYRPEKKCNLYNALRPRLAGGSSDVAIRR